MYSFQMFQGVQNQHSFASNLFECFLLWLFAGLPLKERGIGELIPNNPGPHTDLLSLQSVPIFQFLQRSRL